MGRHLTIPISFMASNDSDVPPNDLLFMGGLISFVFSFVLSFHYLMMYIQTTLLSGAIETFLLVTIADLFQVRP